ncbi:Y-family DNA polymerase [Aminobacter sp. MET-1]|uniref:Y-family DNA polymerase n=1 Tax=Aminobacter sp. MET-1 TaxID=2951085 RepID=UPI002269AC5B|nr:type VI secretion protein ImpB [Aminobacter sp. MET-1]MCX8571141.1 type VI secretion protein ImpB [Aminobacter sp. MET-1]MCX8573190.1 type VI secretion protein ImpB [Aminobacter sp. MET-1]
MRKPETIERLYLDFDGFFASVEQQCDRRLRGRPIGVVPFAGTDRTSIIACSREAKLQGVKNVMGVKEARALCPDIILVPQKPDLYRRAHNALLSEIETVIPIDTAKSIDELTCRLDDAGRAYPEALTARIKQALTENIGPWITCSIGYAANRQLAKMACKAGKRSDSRYGDGLAIWRPQDLPAPLFAVPLADIPGVGDKMAKRLHRAGIFTTQELYAVQPKHMRQLWHNVTGERMWYALHGYDIQAPISSRGMFGHGRVLPPEARTIDGARAISRLLLVKAARRLRRENFYAGGLWLWLSLRDDSWMGKRRIPVVNDDQAILSALTDLWRDVQTAYPRGLTIFRIGVTLYDLSPAAERQLDLLLNDDRQRRRWESASNAIDGLNSRYAATVVSVGQWQPPAGGNAGGKISYTRIPSAEDFW